MKTSKTLATFALLFPAIILLFPSFALAAQNLQGILGIIAALLGKTIPVVTALALLAFIWGLAMYLFGFSGKDEDKKKGRELMVYGVIAIFVIVSIAGIVILLQATFLLDNGPLHVPF
jgi:heme A synthase